MNNNNKIGIFKNILRLYLSFVLILIYMLTYFFNMLINLTNPLLTQNLLTNPKFNYNFFWHMCLIRKHYRKMILHKLKYCS